ncbi:MAG: hypothetical protein ACRBM6_36135, partial [Geminicoccales bacterium]
GLRWIGEVLAHVDANLDTAPSRLLQHPGRTKDVCFDRADLVERDAQAFEQVELAKKLFLGIAAAARAVYLDVFGLRAAEKIYCQRIPS